MVLCRLSKEQIIDKYKHTFYIYYITQFCIGHRKEYNMNKEWSELNKTMQQQIKKKETYSQGINTLLFLRKSLMQQMLSFRDTLPKDAFSAMPYMNANGYHNKTIAYSLWHIFRIEDIVVHTLIRKDEQIFFTGEYQKKIHTSIITTGNELVKEEIADFSKELDLSALYDYIMTVDASTEVILRELTWSDLKIKMTDEDKERIRKLHVVSEDENAKWLIDYWCGKNIQGLIQMPLSRHWIMHVEAALRIAKKL